MGTGTAYPIDTEKVYPLDTDNVGVTITNKICLGIMESDVCPV